MTPTPSIDLGDKLGTALVDGGAFAWQMLLDNPIVLWMLVGLLAIAILARVTRSRRR